MEHRDPTAHETRTNGLLKVGSIRGGIFNYPNIAGLKNDSDPLVREGSQRLSDSALAFETVECHQSEI